MCDLMDWWGYVHKDGSLQVKVFFNQSDIERANQSDFVQFTVGPVKASCREHATEVLQKSISQKGGRLWG